LTNLAEITDSGDTDYLPGDIALRTVVEEQNRTKDGRPAEYKSILKGIAQGSIDEREDWLAKMNFRRLKDTLLQGASKGWKTNLHGTNPIPAYAFGAEFGKGPNKGTY
jgi:hypothetical protein